MSNVILGQIRRGQPVLLNGATPAVVMRPHRTATQQREFAVLDFMYNTGLELKVIPERIYTFRLSELSEEDFYQAAKKAAANPKMVGRIDSSYMGIFNARRRFVLESVCAMMEECGSLNAIMGCAHEREPGTGIYVVNYADADNRVTEFVEADPRQPEAVVQTVMPIVMNDGDPQGPYHDFAVYEVPRAAKPCISRKPRRRLELRLV